MWSACTAVADGRAASKPQLQQHALNMLLVESGILGAVADCATVLKQMNVSTKASA
jgi:predicted house-cleaning NTP pyrophosphatase (Maf/HAM1 superfamily)